MCNKLNNDDCMKALEQLPDNPIGMAIESATFTIWDESSMLRNVDSDAIKEMSKDTPFKFIFAPTPASNDIDE